MTRCMLVALWSLFVAFSSAADVDSARSAMAGNDFEEAVQLLDAPASSADPEAQHLLAVSIFQIWLSSQEEVASVADAPVVVRELLSSSATSGYSAAKLDLALLQMIDEGGHYSQDTFDQLNVLLDDDDPLAVKILFSLYCDGEPIGGIEGNRLLSTVHRIVYSEGWRTDSRMRFSLVGAHGRANSGVFASLTGAYAMELATGGCFASDSEQARTLLSELAQDERFQGEAYLAISGIVSVFDDWGLRPETRVPVQPNKRTKFEWLTLASDLGIASEMQYMDLAQHYARGDVVVRDMELSRRALRKCWLTDLEKSGAGPRKSQELSVDLYSDDVSRCFDFGLYDAIKEVYLQSTSSADVAIAEDMFWFLVFRPDYDYRVMDMADMYFDGSSTRQNYENAFLLYELQASENPIAQFRLGYMYSNGLGTREDAAKAREYYALSASNGQNGAKYNLALLLRDGRGGPKDLVGAARILKDLAELGDVSAQSEYGRMVSEGEGVLENDVEAVQWLLLAANAGHPNAQHNLAVQYAYGEGTAIDLVQAYKWANLAAAQGNDKANELKRRLTQLMPRQKVHYAQQLSAEFEPSQDTSSANGRDSGLEVSAKPAVKRNGVVATIQKGLSELGYYDGAIDGLYGPITSTAIADFQRTNELEVTGEANADLALYIGAALGSKLGDGEVRPSSAERYSSSGTGFLVSSAGHLVTNAHVVTACSKVTLANGTLLSLQAYDPEADLALLSSSKYSDIQPLPLRAGRGVRLADQVLVAGFPLTGIVSPDVNVTIGNISSLSGPDGARNLIQITAPVQIGNSGGPIVDDSGRVVGVVVAKLDALQVASATGDVPQNVNFGVSLGVLQSFLDANSIDYVVQQNGSTISNAEAAARVQRATYQIQCH